MGEWFLAHLLAGDPSHRGSLSPAAPAVCIPCHASARCCPALPRSGCWSVRSRGPLGLINTAAPSSSPRTLYSAVMSSNHPSSGCTGSGETRSTGQFEVFPSDGIPRMGGAIGRSWPQDASCLGPKSRLGEGSTVGCELSKARFWPFVAQTTPCATIGDPFTKSPHFL